MKTIKILGLAAYIVITILSLAAFVGQDKLTAKKNISKAEGSGFAVLELFTSEGCSSCPPADEILAKIQRESQGKSIYLLAYHVDYWDRQGWKDTFSDADYSNRQAQYGRWFNLSTIYTPQMVVNGKAEFIGSEESSIRSSIIGQLAINRIGQLALEVHQNNRELNVHYVATEIRKESNFLIAVVQKSAQNKVERGENAGRDLSHVQIVRKLQVETLEAGGNGSTKVLLPKDFNVKNFEIMAMIQDKKTGEILSAARAVLRDDANSKSR